MFFFHLQTASIFYKSNVVECSKLVNKSVSWSYKTIIWPYKTVSWMLSAGGVPREARRRRPPRARGRNGANPKTYPKPETRNSRPETRNRNPKPETQDPKPKTQNPKLKTQNPISKS